VTRKTIRQDAREMGLWEALNRRLRSRQSQKKGGTVVTPPTRTTPAAITPTMATATEPSGSDLP
jgi:hypothetical protein